MRYLLPIAIILIFFWGCGEERVAELVEDEHLVTYAPGVIDSMPKVQFGDGQISLNDRCAVRTNKLSTKIPAVYVNGYPVAFC